MIIQLTAEEVTRIVTSHLKNNIAGLEGMDYESGIGLINGELSMVVAIEQQLDHSIFDNQDDTDEEEDNTNEGDTPANGEDKPVKSKGKGKRTRRTRAQIEEDERREREQVNPENGSQNITVAPVEAQTEVPADTTPPFAVDEPEFGELEREAAAPEVIEETKDENLFGGTEPAQEPVQEEVTTDAGLFDTGATNNPFAEPGEAVAESSDTNLFSVDPAADSEFQKPVEDDTEVFNLFK